MSKLGKDYQDTLADSLERTTRPGTGMSGPMSDAEVAAQICECCATHGPDNAARYESLLRTLAEKEVEISKGRNEMTFERTLCNKWQKRAHIAESALTAANEALRVERKECERLRTVKDAAIVQAKANRCDAERYRSLDWQLNQNGIDGYSTWSVHISKRDEPYPKWNTYYIGLPFDTVHDAIDDAIINKKKLK